MGNLISNNSLNTTEEIENKDDTIVKDDIDTTVNDDLILYKNYTDKCHILSGSSLAPGQKYSNFREYILTSIAWLKFNPYLKIPNKKGWILPHNKYEHIYNILTEVNISFNVVDYAQL